MWTPRPNTRYFRLEQLCTLDTILFFIEVGIPLRTLKEYIDGSGNIDRERLLQEARDALKRKTGSLKAMITATEFDLMNLQQNRWSTEEVGVFEREIIKRHFIVMPFEGEWENRRVREKMAMDLFRAAKSAGLYPTFPAGIIIHWNARTQKLAYSIFV